MRFLIKIVLPTAAENPLVGEPDFESRLNALFRRIGALANYPGSQDGRRIEYVLVEVDPGQITPTAEPLFRFLGVKPEFLPEMVPSPYYGRSGY